MCDVVGKQLFLLANRGQILQVALALIDESNDK